MHQPHTLSNTVLLTNIPMPTSTPKKLLTVRLPQDLTASIFPMAVSKLSLIPLMITLDSSLMSNTKVPQHTQSLKPQLTTLPQLQLTTPLHSSNLPQLIKKLPQIISKKVYRL
jgi:hypothetical protein